MIVDTEKNLYQEVQQKKRNMSLWEAAEATETRCRREPEKAALMQHPLQAKWMCERFPNEHEIS